MKNMIIFGILSLALLFSSSNWISINENNLENENIRVNSSDIFKTNLTFEIDSFNFIDVEGENGKIVRLQEGAQLLQHGAPDLPQLATSIIIPDDQVMEVNIISSNYIDFENIEILPSKGNLSRLIDPSIIPFEYGPSYSQNEFFPGKLQELREPYILRDIRGITVVIYPIQYNPVSKTLRAYNEIVVEISSIGRDINNVLNRENLPNTRPFEFENIYKSHFINSQYDLRFDYLVDHGNMLIISNEAFMSTMNPFIEWKTLKGIPVEMVSITDAGGNASAIKNYISNYYSNNGLTFLLLVGDEGQVPSIFVGGSASDPSYGFIDGNDSYSEILVGRFSGQNPTQIATQVERTINYERYPQANAEWYDNALGIASNQGPGWGGLTDDDFNDMLWETVLSVYNYDSYEGIYDGSGGSDAQGISAINTGVGIINYTGHGSISSWGNGASLNTTQINSLTNNNRLPFVITVGCNVGEFNSTNESFAEAWLRATNNGEATGAISHMGSTISQSWEPPMHGQYGMNLILTESYDNHKTRTMAGIATNGCMYMNDMQGSSGINETNYWTFFGDPSVNIRTLPPSNLNANYESTILIGQENFSINTGNEGDLIALSRNGVLLSTGYTNSSGNANLNIENVSSIPGIVNLVISSYNKYVYESEITVISPEGAYLVMDNFYANNSINFGSTVGISLQLSNVGSDPAENTQLELSCDDQFVSINGMSINLGNIANDQTIQTSEFEFIISPNIPDGHQFTVDYNLNSGLDQWDGTFSLTASAPNLEVSSVLVNAACGTLWPGGNGSISLEIKNSGSVALNVPDVDVSNSGNSEVSNVIQNFVPSLYGDLSLSLSFDIAINNEVQLGTNLNPILIITSNEIDNYSYSLNFDVLVGLLIENFETGDFSCHDWISEGQNGWTVSSASAFDGREKIS